VDDVPIRECPTTECFEKIAAWAVEGPHKWQKYDAPITPEMRKKVANRRAGIHVEPANAQPAASNARTLDHTTHPSEYPNLSSKMWRYTVEKGDRWVAVMVDDAETWIILSRRRNGLYYVARQWRSPLGDVLEDTPFRFGAREDCVRAIEKWCAEGTDRWVKQDAARLNQKARYHLTMNAER
jgi:hypothetical protein